MNSLQIKDLISQKHSKDIVIHECKTGGTWFNNNLGIIDSWVINHSWVNEKAIAYEIKVSRADFLNDNKWQKYLPFCHEFYFVAPWGLIDPREIPDQAGLLVCSKNIKKLYTKKKAPYRTENINYSDILRYIVNSRYPEKEKQENCNREYWENWLKDKKYDWELGNKVSKALSKKIREDIRNQKITSDNLQAKIERLEDIKTIVEKYGLTRWDSEERIIRKIKGLDEFEKLKNSLTALQERIRDIEGEK